MGTDVRGADADGVTDPRRCSLRKKHWWGSHHRVLPQCGSPSTSYAMHSEMPLPPRSPSLCEALEPPSRQQAVDGAGLALPREEVGLPGPGPKFVSSIILSCSHSSTFL